MPFYKSVVITCGWWACRKTIPFCFELVSMGSVNRTIAEPMEIYSFALQKRAVKIILVHNHPFGNLQPSAEDKDLTYHMIQVGKIVTPLIDHLIITTANYFSFDNVDLMKELALSMKYVPHYLLQQRLKVKARELKNEQAENKKLKKRDAKLRQAIIKLHERGESIEDIKLITGVTKKEIVS